VDLCPVGALTHKPWAFNYRPWELKKTETIDVHDAVGANIRVDARGSEVMRVLPRTNEAVNEEWIDDKTRYAVDGLMRQRLDRPFLRKNGKLAPATWAEAFEAIAAKVKAAPAERVGAIAGDLQDAESLKAARDLFAALGSPNLDCRQDGMVLGGGPRETWLFNSTIAGIEQADAIMLIGTNPRLEAPLVNARLRKSWLATGVRIGLVGEKADLNYAYHHVGAGPAALQQMFDSHTAIKAQKPAFIVGAGVTARSDAAALLNVIGEGAAKFGVVKDGWNGFNVLHTAASRVGGLDMGFIPGRGGLSAKDMVKAGALDVLFLLGADEIDTAASDAFVVYLGTHGDAGAHKADVILPAAAYTEKAGLYVNMEGRVQMANRAVFPKGEAREDWAILRALSQRLGRTLPYDSLAALRKTLIGDHPTFGQVDYAPGSIPARLDLAKLGKKGKVADAAFTSPIADFYQTNPIARASVTMAECSALAASLKQAPVAAE
jgi:NADH-quinone oxidoreductase subunit G